MTAQLQQETPAFWRCQYHGRATKDRGSSGVGLLCWLVSWKLDQRLELSEVGEPQLRKASLELELEVL